MFISLIIAIIFAIVAVFFALENTEIVRVHLFGYPLEGALGVFLLGALGLGALLGLLTMAPAALGRSILISRQKRRIQELEQSTPAQPADMQ